MGREDVFDLHFELSPHPPTSPQPPHPPSPPPTLRSKWRVPVTDCCVQVARCSSRRPSCCWSVDWSSAWPPWLTNAQVTGLAHQPPVSAPRVAPPRWPSGQGVRLESGRSRGFESSRLRRDFFGVESYQSHTKQIITTHTTSTTL